MPPGDVAPFMITLIITVSVAAVLILRGPLGRALARRLEGQSGEAALRDEVELLHQRVAELEQAQARLGDLEERMDFSERLLARAQPARELADGSVPGVVGGRQ